MKKIFWLIIISVATLNAQEFTLEKALQTGLSNSKFLNIYKSKAVAAQAKIDEINAGFYPKISAGFTYARLSDIPAFEIQTPIFPKPIKIQDPILNSYNLRAGFQLPVFLGFKLTSLRNATIKQAEIAHTDYDAKTNDEALKIVDAFWNYYKADHGLKLVQERLKSMRSHHKDAENLFEQGLIKKSELLKINLELKNMESALIELENKVVTARTVFNSAIGIGFMAESKLKADGLDNYEEYNLEDLIKEAMQNRLELKSGNLRTAAANELIKSARAGYFPTLSVFGNYYYSRPNQRILPLEDKFNDTWELGVSVNWSVFDWGKTSAQVSQAEQQYVEAKNSIELLKDKIRIEVIKTYSDYVSALAQIKAQKAAVEVAEENLKIVTNQFNQQLSNATDLTDAETLLLKAETDLLFARINASVLKTKLLKATGRKIY